MELTPVQNSLGLDIDKNTSFRSQLNFIGDKKKIQYAIDC